MVSDLGVCCRFFKGNSINEGLPLVVDCALYVVLNDLDFSWNSAHIPAAQPELTVAAIGITEFSIFRLVS